ncbi:MAG TPA: hypothetical protein VGC09_13960 [Rhodopila sp.]
MSDQRFTGVGKAVGHASRLEPGRPGLSQAPAETGVWLCVLCGCGAGQAWQMVAGRSGQICCDCIPRACEAVMAGGTAVPPDRLREWLTAWERVGAWLLAQKHGQR